MFVRANIWGHFPSCCCFPPSDYLLIWYEIKFSLSCFVMQQLDKIFFLNSLITTYPILLERMASFRPGRSILVVVISVVIAAVLVDTSIATISVFTGGLIAYNSNIGIFTSIVVIYAISQFIILRFAAPKGKQQPKQRRLIFIYKVVSISQYVVLALLIAIILQMTFTFSYCVMLFKIIIWSNYIISIALLGLLSERFFSWFRSKRDFVIIAYAIAMMALSINFVFTILYVTSELTRLEDSEYIQPLRSLVSTVYEVNKQLNSAFFHNIYFIVHIDMVCQCTLITSLL
jgi:hypothetical protein